MPEITFGSYIPIRNTRESKYKSSGIAASLAASAVRSQWQNVIQQDFATAVTMQTELHKFCNLAFTWKEDTKMMSSMRDIALHPAYQEIIGMGKSAISYILDDLAIELSLWFWALRAITGDNPVPVTHQGDFEKMRKDWLIWGEENGYI